MSERLGIFERFFPKRKPQYTPFNIGDWQERRDEGALTEPRPSPPVVEQSPISTPLKAYEAQPSKVARFVAPRRAARQKAQTR